MRSAFILGVALTVGCGKNYKPETLPAQSGGSPTTKDGPKINPPRGEPAEREPVETEPPPDIRPGESVKLGPVTLKFRTVGIRNHQVLSDGQWAFLGGTQLSVVLDIKHDDPTKIIDVSPLSDGAVGTDDLGNKYQFALSPGDSRWVAIEAGDQVLVGTRKRLRSDEMFTDMILLERPVPAAKTIYVTINAARFGQKGKVRLVVSQAELLRKAKKP